MNKSELRKQYIAIRKQLTNKELKSLLIYKKLISNFYYINSKTIGIYSSLPSEVFTDKIINESLNRKKRVVVPVVLDKEKLDYYEINSLDELCFFNKMNIKEPICNTNNIVLPNEIDLFIVPGVCFDLNKNRIGFGGGYYDRYLKKSPNSYKIGICFNEQILYDGFIESDSTDVKLDEIITDKVLIK